MSAYIPVELQRQIIRLSIILSITIVLLQNNFQMRYPY